MKEFHRLEQGRSDEFQQNTSLQLTTRHCLESKVHYFIFCIEISISKIIYVFYATSTYFFMVNEYN
jgi:hypothetical protein